MVNLADDHVHLSGWAARSELAYTIAGAGRSMAAVSALYGLPDDVAADVRAILDAPPPAPAVGDRRHMTCLSFGVGVEVEP